MHVSLVRSFFALTGLTVCSSLMAEQQQEFPTYRELKEEQRIIQNAFLVRGEMTYLPQAKAQFSDNNLRSAAQNFATAALLLSRAKERMDMHPTRIEQARNALGFRLSESDRKELRDSLHNDIDPRFFSLQTALESLEAKFEAKGDTSLRGLLDDAKNGDTSSLINKMKQKNLNVEKDTSGLTPTNNSNGGGGGGGGGGGNQNTGGNTGGGSGGIASIPGLPGASATQNPNNTVTLNIPGMGSFTGQGTITADGKFIDVPGVGRIDISTIRKDANGNVVAQSDKGAVYLGPDGQWHLGTPPATGGGNGGGGGGGGTANARPIINGEEMSDLDIQDGVFRRYIGPKGGLLVSEQKIALDKNADGSPKVDAAGKPLLTLGDRRTWKFRLNLGEQKSVGGSVQQTVTLLEDGGSTAFTVSGFEVVSKEGSRASAEQRSNSGEAVVTYPRNGTYVVSVSGKTDWGSAFRYQAEVPVFQ